MPLILALWIIRQVAYDSLKAAEICHFDTKMRLFALFHSLMAFSKLGFEGIGLWFWVEETNKYALDFLSFRFIFFSNLKVV